MDNLRNQDEVLELAREAGAEIIQVSHTDDEIGEYHYVYSFEAHQLTDFTTAITAKLQKKSQGETVGYVFEGFLENLELLHIDTIYGKNYPHEYGKPDIPLYLHPASEQTQSVKDALEMAAKAVFEYFSLTTEQYVEKYGDKSITADDVIRALIDQPQPPASQEPTDAEIRLYLEQGASEGLQQASVDDIKSVLKYFQLAAKG